jgi:hypothetical protein
VQVIAIENRKTLNQKAPNNTIILFSTIHYYIGDCGGIIDKYGSLTSIRS